MINSTEILTTDFFYADPIGMWVSEEALSGIIMYVSFIENNKHKSKSNIFLPVSSDLYRYFQGEIVDFSAYSIDMSGYTAFQQDVLTAARSIPYGTCITYSQLAEMIGRPSAVRAVANALGKNKTPIIIPCHRVVSKHGVGGFSCGVDLKLKLLKLESILI